MCQPRSSDRYLDGLNKFLDFAFSNVSQGDQILYPCKNSNDVSVIRYLFVAFYGSFYGTITTTYITFNKILKNVAKAFKKCYNLQR